MILNNTKKITIAIDAWFAADVLPRGIGKVSQDLIEEIINDCSKNYIIFTPKITRYFDKILKKPHCKIIKIDFPYPVYEQIMVPFYCFKYQAELLHSLASTMPLVLPRSCKRLLTLHDVIFLEKSVYYYCKTRNFGALYRNLCLRFLNKSNVFFHFISDYTAKSYGSHFKEKGNHVIIHSGINSNVQRAAEDMVTNINQKNYLFALGAEDPRKKTKELIQLFIENNHKWPETRLVIAGVQDVDLFLKKMGTSLKSVNSQNIDVLSYVSEEELYHLYAGARGFLFLSTSEGFGLPIIEAQLFGVKSVVSNSTSCKEIAGPDAILVNPELNEQIISAISSVVEQGSVGPENRIRWARRFNWTRVAKRINKVYEEIARNSA